MSLQKISEDEAKSVLTKALGENAMQGMIILGEALAAKEKSAPVAQFSLTHDFQAELANEVLDKSGYNPSERYTPSDFIRVDNVIPAGLPAQELRHICDNVKDAFRRYVTNRNGLVH